MLYKSGFVTEAVAAILSNAVEMSLMFSVAAMRIVAVFVEPATDIKRNVINVELNNMRFSQVLIISTIFNFYYEKKLQTAKCTLQLLKWFSDLSRF